MQASKWRNLQAWMARCALLAIVLSVAGCGYWGWQRLEQPTSLGPRETVRLWTGGTVLLWHAVVISDESVSGISQEKSLKCDSCVQIIPRTQIDSMKVGYETFVQKLVITTGVLLALKWLP